MSTSADTELQPGLGDRPSLADIVAAERVIRPRLPETPTVCAWDLQIPLGQPLWLKCENLQPTGAFKVRGVLNWLRNATKEELERGLVTVSAGNHAQSLAWAAAELGLKVTVVMPEGSSSIKIQTTRDFGAEVIIHGTIQEAVALCFRLQQERQLTLVHPYNNAHVIAGQGTVALELLRQLPTVTRILCPIGGGGLISGMGIALKAMRPDVQFIGVEPRGAATMRNAWNCADPKASLERVDTVARSLAPAIVGDLTYAISRRVVDDIVTVSDEAIQEATRLLLTRGHLYAEPGAAVGVAALLENAVPVDKHSVTAAVVTGGNMDLRELYGFANR